MAVDLPVQSIHRQIASALDVIVQIARLPNGRRGVTQIAEVAGYDAQTGKIVLHDIFNRRNGSVLSPTGFLPTFVDSLMEKRLLELEFLYGADDKKRLILETKALPGS